MQYYPERLRNGLILIILAVPAFLVTLAIYPPIAGIVLVVFIVSGVAEIIFCVNIEVWDTAYKRL